MPDLLTRYAGWLAAQAPNTAAAARPPAADADIADAEQELGAALPASIRELYRWHDGGPNNSDREDRQMKAEVAEEEFGPEEADFYWDPHWFPIGTSWTGDLLVVDCSTSPARGRVSVAGNEGPVASNPVWVDLDALLRELVGALENRMPLSGYVPAARDGWLVWEELP